MTGFMGMMMAQFPTGLVQLDVNANVFRSVTLAAQAIAGYRLTASGLAQKREASTYTTLETWLLAGTNNLYAGRFTLISGDTPTVSGTTLGTWTTLTTAIEVNIQDTDPSPAGIKTSNILCEIRRIADSVVLASATISLTSDYETV